MNASFRKILKSGLPVFILLYAILLSSCMLFNSGKNSEQSVTVNFHGEILLPSGFDDDVFANIAGTSYTAPSERTAFPYLDSATDNPNNNGSNHIEYFATAAATGYEDRTAVFGTGDSANEFEIPLQTGTWTITAGMKFITGTPSASNVIFQDSYVFTVSQEVPQVSHTFNLSLVKEGTGSVNLKMSIPQSVSSIDLLCDDDVWNSTIQAVSGDIVTITPAASASQKTATLTISSIAAGDYTVTFVFRDSNGVILYISEQVICVAQGLTTNGWGSMSGWQSPDNSANMQVVRKDGTFKLTDAIIAQFVQTSLYVGQTDIALSLDEAADDRNSGSVYSPFATFAPVLKYLARGTGEAYKIFVTGSINNVQIQFPATLTTDNVARITIQGLSALSGTALSNDLTDYLIGKNVSQADGSVLTFNMSNDIPVIIRNLGIKNGKTTETGGGVNVKSGNVTLENCRITASSADDSGGAINLTDGSLSLKNCLISHNSAAENGGGVNISSGTLSLENCSISGNSAYENGGGINISSGTLSLENCSISGNSAAENGGGINVAAGTDITINNSEIQGNGISFSGNGGGVYVDTAATATGQTATSVTLQGKVVITQNERNTDVSGSSTVSSNLYMPSAIKLTIENDAENGDFSESDIGINVPLSGSEKPTADSSFAFTNGYNYNVTGGVSELPGAIFKPENGYNVYYDSDNEAAFVVSSGNTVYNPLDYQFDFTLKDSASKTVWFVKKDTPKPAFISVSVNRIEQLSGSDPTALYYNPADHKLYKSSQFTSSDAEESGKSVTLSASLYRNGVFMEALALSTGSLSITVPQLKFTGDYTVVVSTDFMGLRHQKTFPVKCLELPDGSVPVPSATASGAVGSKSVSEVFIADRNINIPSLIADDHEVTQSEYAQYMTYYGVENNTDDNKPVETYGIGDNFPVYNVSWYDAIIYCNLKSLADDLTPVYYLADSNGTELEGSGNGRNPDFWRTVEGTNIEKNAGSKYYYNATVTSTKLNYSGTNDVNGGNDGGIRFDQDADGWRLPTDVEWEYLARGGNLTNIGETLYSGSDTVDDVAWYGVNSLVQGTKKAHEVKTKNPNSLGLYDMSGNVWEWCWDLVGTISTDTDSTGPQSGINHIYRGGCFNDDSAENCTVSFRSPHGQPHAHSPYLGFRVVRTAK